MLKRILLMIVALLCVSTFTVQAQATTDSNYTMDYGSFTIEGQNGVAEGDFIVFEKGYLYLPFHQGMAENEGSVWEYEDEDREWEDEDGDWEYADEEDDWNDDIDNSAVLEIAGLRHHIASQQFDLSQASVAGSFDVNNLAWVLTDGASLDQEGLHLQGSAYLNSNVIEGLYEGLRISEFTLSREGELSLQATMSPGTSFILCNSFQVSTNTIYFRNEEDFRSIYFRGGSIEFCNALAELFTGSPIGEINIIEIEDNNEVIKFDTTLHQTPIYFSSMEANLYVSDIDPDSVSFGGRVLLPQAMPGDLHRLPLRIHHLEVDTRTGAIYSFTAYPESFKPISIDGWTFEIYGLKFKNDQIQFTSGFKVPGGILTKIYPNGLAGNIVNCNDFTLSYEGIFKKLDADIPLPVTFVLENGVTVETRGLGLEIENATLTNKILLFEKPFLVLKDGTRIAGDGLGVDQEGKLIWPRQLRQYQSEFKMKK